MNLGLKDRVALVTGGSKGIGKAIARALASEGVHLALLARTREDLEAAADDIRFAKRVRVQPITADVRDAESVKAAVDAAAAEFGTIHILVNNAGSPIRRHDRQIMWPDTEWLDDINTKTIGMLRVTQAVIPSMPTDGSGRIINISGIAGLAAFGPALTHGLNNSAMNHATSYLAKDLAESRITVNAVVPGLIATEWREGWAADGASKQGLDSQGFVEDICKKWGIIARRWGTMQEVADLVVFLASDRAAYINGARIPIDGGFSINPR
jgi:NAD(P)-dependent dehydrogenase (short-subunit alcohol dehydrogenase family)